MSYIQRHYPPGSPGCTREITVGQDGKYQVKRSNGTMKSMDDTIQAAIKQAIANGDDKAIYSFNGSQYYFDLNGGDDIKDESDSDISDVDDLLNDPEPGLSFIGDGAGQKVDIPFSPKESVVGLKHSFADKMQCDPDELQILAFVNGEFVEVATQTLEDNKVNDPKDLIIFKQEDRTEAVKKLIRAKKWEDKAFRKQAKKWLKGTGNEGKKGIDNLIKKNGLDEGWQDVLTKLDYTDVLKIVKDENIMSRIDKIRVDGNERKKYNISDDLVATLTYQQISKMHQKTTALREKFYADMRVAALEGIDLELDTDCNKIFEQFDPNETDKNGKPLAFYGIILLIDPKELKLRGIPCKNVKSLKKGQIYLYPSFSHNKKIEWRGKEGQNNCLQGSGTGHGQLCDLAGLPPDFCAGFAIEVPVLKFRSGTCNSSKIGKVDGFDSKALGAKLQEGLQKSFKGTKVERFYSEIDTRKSRYD